MEKGQPFHAQVHIEKPVVKLMPSRKYFTLTDVTYEQVSEKSKEKGGKKPAEGGGEQHP